MKRQYYLLAVDSFSKCKNPTWSGTIRFLHELFARFAISDPIVSVNGTQFKAREFKDFCKAFPIVYITSVPYHQYCILDRQKDF